MINRQKAWLVVGVAWLLSLSVVAEDALELPPPPEAEAPAIDLARVLPNLPLLPEVPDEEPFEALGEEIYSAPAPAGPIEIMSGSTVLPEIVLPPTMRDSVDPQSGGASFRAEASELLNAIGEEAPGRSALESMLFEQLQGALPGGGDGYLFEKIILPDLVFPEGAWSARFDFHLPARGIGQAPFTGTILKPDGSAPRRFSGSIWIDREATGVQVARVIHPGEPLRVTDLEAFPTRLSNLPRGAFDELAVLEGTVARRELRPGQWLVDQMVKVPEVVKRNQAVTIRLRRGPISISAPGLTRQPGAMGEVIRVENTASRREIYARVMANDEVQVMY